MLLQLGVLTLLFRSMAIEDLDLLVRVVQFPRLALVLVVEVHNKQRVLHVNEEVTLIRHLGFLGILFVWNYF